MVTLSSWNDPIFSPAFNRSVAVRIVKSAVNARCIQRTRGLYVNWENRGRGGSVLEHAVYNQLRWRYENINYYQRRSGAEIDFLLDYSIGIEVKESARENDIRKLNNLKDDLSLDEAYVVSEQYLDSNQVIAASDL